MAGRATRSDREYLLRQGQFLLFDLLKRLKRYWFAILKHFERKLYSYTGLVGRRCPLVCAVDLFIDYLLDLIRLTKRRRLPGMTFRFCFRF